MNEIVQINDAMTVETGTVALLAAAEIDQQIATAKKYRRSLQSFRQESLSMVTLNEQIAQECIYSLPRDGKTIEGPSARFAEVIASAWGNCRAGARVVNEGAEFVTAQGVFHDLERNMAITYEVQRRITGKNGRRFSPDMIGVTANAACSIALRNAILKGVPKAFWSEVYQAARHTIMGDYSTLANRRDNAIKAFTAYGVTKEQIFSVLGLKGINDIGLEHLVTLGGMLTAIKEGDTTPEQAFGQQKVNADAPPPPPPPAAKVDPQKTETKSADVPPTAEAAAPEPKKETASPPPPPSAGAADEPKRFVKVGKTNVLDNETGELVPKEFLRLFDDGGFSVLKTYQEYLNAPPVDQAAQAEPSMSAPPPPPPPADDQVINPDEFLKEIENEMAQASDLDQVDAIWFARTPEDVLDFPGDLDAARAIYDKHRQRLGRAA